MSLAVLRSQSLRYALRTPQMTRRLHVENTVGDNMPFNYTTKKTAFGVKLAAYLVFGFSIPVVASAYQLRKAGSA